MAGNLHALRHLLTPRPGVGSRPQGARGAGRALGLLAVYGSKSALGMPLRPTTCPDNGDPRPPGLVFE